MILSTRGETVTLNGIQLTSAINRQREAEQLAATIPADTEECWVYGPALGDVIAELLKRPALKINVVPLVESLPLPVFDDPRVVFHRSADVDCLHSPFVASPVELAQASESAWHIRDRVNAALNQPFNELLFSTMGKKTWDAQEKANARFLAVDPPVKALTLTDERDAIVVGGGPTVALFYDWIRAQDMNIIAASTALGPLLKQGIEPDVVVCIDREPAMVKHFTQRCFGELVYHPAIHPDIVMTWPGKRYVVRDGDLYCGGSVIHNQIDLAVRMGAKNVYLVGADFCYPGGQSHMPGAALPFNANDLGTQYCINGHGEKVRTDANLAQYRCFVEDYARVNEHIGFWKLGRDGAETRYVKWLDL